jgi:hypothetical protein
LIDGNIKINNWKSDSVNLDLILKMAIPSELVQGSNEVPSLPEPVKEGKLMLRMGK